MKFAAWLLVVCFTTTTVAEVEILGELGKLEDAIEQLSETAKGLNDQSFKLGGGASETFTKTVEEIEQPTTTVEDMNNDADALYYNDSMAEMNDVDTIEDTNYGSDGDQGDYWSPDEDQDEILGELGKLEDEVGQLSGKLKLLNGDDDSMAEMNDVDTIADSYYASDENQVRDSTAASGKEAWDAAESKYLFVNKKMKYADAEKYCQSWGGHLVTVNSKDENTYLFQEAKKRKLSWIYYIGYDDIAIEGKFEWTSGARNTSYTNWSGREPNGGRRENCGMAYKWSGGWNDLSCNRKISSICEKPRVSMCPRSHPHAYYDGEYCCKTGKENSNSHYGDKCDGGVISHGSKCCERNDVMKCTMGNCVNYNKELDECIVRGKCANANCLKQSDDTFKCRCNTGFAGDGQTCIDVNECAANGGGGCGANAVCINTPGSFKCQCNAGYLGDGKTCVDIDECGGSSGCSTEAYCTNTPGSFKCTCNQHYTGDGKTCSREWNLISNETELQKGKVVGTLAKLTRQYEITFELKAAKFTGELRNVLHFQASGATEEKKAGYRVPLITAQAKPVGALLIVAPVKMMGKKKNIHMYETLSLKSGEWYTIKVAQTKVAMIYTYTISINGVQVLSIMNNDANEFHNVTVYAASPYTAALQASIRNLRVKLLYTGCQATSGGSAKDGSCCLFPFKNTKRRLSYACSNDHKERPWCNTADGKWGFCVPPKEREYKCVYVKGDGAVRSDKHVSRSLKGEEVCADACMQHKRYDPTIDGAATYVDNKKAGCWCKRNTVGRRSNKNAKACIFEYTRNTGVCPIDHPHPFSSGRACCKNDREKEGGRENCNFGKISMNSACCLRDQYTRCKRPPCKRNDEALKYADGKWGAWKAWSPCSLPCNGGTQTTSRSCDNPKPRLGGVQCVATDGESKSYEEKSRSCNVHQCAGYHMKTAAIMGRTNYGTTRPAIICPSGSKVTGFRVKMETPFIQDKTGLAGIQLACSDGSVTKAVEMRFNEGLEWTQWTYCDGKATESTKNVVTGFNYRSLPGKEDNTGGTAIKMKCSNNVVLEQGVDAGDWDRVGWAACDTTSVFCGVQTKIQHHIWDDSGMNKIRFICCRVSPPLSAPIAGWLLLASDICVGARDDDFGIFYMSRDALLTGMKLVHVDGEVNCLTRYPQMASNFGCNHQSVQNMFSIFVSLFDTDTKRDLMFLPSYKHAQQVHRAWYRLAGAEPPNKAKSMDLFTRHEPFFLEKGEEVRVWYGEDFHNIHEGDNGGHTCLNVYGQFLN